MKWIHTNKTEKSDYFNPISDNANLFPNSFNKHSHSITFIQMEKKEQEEPEHLPSIIFCNMPPKLSLEDPLTLGSSKKLQKLPEKLEKPTYPFDIDVVHSTPLKKDTRKSSIKSFFSQYMVLSNYGLSKKLYFFSRNILLSHMMAYLLTILKILIQVEIKQYCWVADKCSCNNDIHIKLYSSIMDCLTCWAFYFIINSKTVFILKEYRHVKWLKILYFSISSLFVLIYSIVIDEKDYNSIHIYIIEMILPLLLFMVYLYTLKFSIKVWLKNFLRANALHIFVFGNYLLIRFIVPVLKEDLIVGISDFWSKNIKQLIVVAYFNVFFIGMKHCLLIYYLFALEQKQACNEQNIENIDYTSAVSLMRFAVGFCFSINLSSILNMSYNDFGGWILLLFYIHFVVKTYLNYDILEKTYNLFKGMLHKSSSLPIENHAEKVYFEKLYSGCMLDFQLIAISRMLYWYYGKRWFSISFILEYIDDCEFSISKSFEITTFGFISALLINILLLAVIVGYMIKRRKILLEYKSRNQFFYNIFFLFLLHAFFEGCIQVSSFVG